MDSIQIMKRATELAEAHYTQKEILQWLTRDRIPLPMNREQFAEFLCKHFRLAYSKGFQVGHSD